MQCRDVYLGQESFESINTYIEVNLKNGSSVLAIANSLLGTDKAEIIITKWEGVHINEFSREEKIEILKQYITEYSHKCVKRSCVSDDIKRLMEEHYYEMGLDTYSDYLTELINSDGYQRVSHHITNIMACFKPYMIEKCPSKFKDMSNEDMEVALVEFLKEHLSIAGSNEKQ